MKMIINVSGLARKNPSNILKGDETAYSASSTYLTFVKEKIKEYLAQSNLISHGVALSMEGKTTKSITAYGNNAEILYVIGYLTDNSGDSRIELEGSEGLITLINRHLIEVEKIPKELISFD